MKPSLARCTRVPASKCLHVEELTLSLQTRPTGALKALDASLGAEAAAWPGAWLGISQGRTIKQGIIIKQATF